MKLRENNMVTDQEYKELWAKVLKAADACNNAPGHKYLDALKRFHKAQKAATEARKALKL